MSLRRLCTDTVNIEQNDGTADGAGGTPASWTVAYAAEPCRIQVIEARRIMRFTDQEWGGMPTDVTHRIYFSNGDLVLNESMRIVRGSVVFRIIGIQNWDWQNKYFSVDVEQLK